MVALASSAHIITIHVKYHLPVDKCQSEFIYAVMTHFCMSRLLMYQAPIHHTLLL